MRCFSLFVVVVQWVMQDKEVLWNTLFAFSLINSGRISLLKYLLLISLAATIHKSSIVLAPFGLFLIKRNLFLKHYFHFYLFFGLIFCTSSRILIYILGGIHWIRCRFLRSFNKNFNGFIDIYFIFFI